MPANYVARVAIFLLPLALIACSDTVSDVGVDLLDAEVGPNARSVALTEFDVSDLQDYTGGTTRVLAGRVEDPMAGVIEAEGYIDFTGAFTISDTSTIVRAELVLSRSYVYGDAQGSVTLDVYNLAESWDPTGLQADTVLTAGVLAAQATFAAADTQVVIPLPDAWLRNYRSTVRSADVDSLFHGFKLAPQHGNTIAGFRITGSSLRFVTTGETTSFVVNQTFSGIVRSGMQDIPDQTLLLQDGAGPVIKLDFDLSNYAETPINGVVITVMADTAAVAMTPAGFTRPLARELQLVSVPEDVTQPATFLGQAPLGDNGTYRFVSVDLTTFLQRVLVGTESYAYLELRAPVPDNSLDVVLLYKGTDPSIGPQAYMILSQ